MFLESTRGIRWYMLVLVQDDVVAVVKVGIEAAFAVRVVGVYG